MSDALYLSLWYPNLRLAALADKLVSVLETFHSFGGEPRVYSVTVWPVDWHESPTLQHVWGHGERGVEPRQAVETALELLHDDYAYEFQIGWNLWELEKAEGREPRWARSPHLVRVTAFGPLFSEGCYEQEGHLRIDFGPDEPFLEEGSDLAAVGLEPIQENIAQLIALTRAVDKASSASARLLWSELGESLAARLAARLGMEN